MFQTTKQLSCRCCSSWTLKFYPYFSYDKGERFRTSIDGDRNIPTSWHLKKYPLLCGHKSHNSEKSPHSKFLCCLVWGNILTSFFFPMNQIGAGVRHDKENMSVNRIQVFCQGTRIPGLHLIALGPWRCVLICQLFNKSYCDEVKTT